MLKKERLEREGTGTDPEKTNVLDVFKKDEVHSLKLRKNSKCSIGHPDDRGESRNPGSGPKSLTFGVLVEGRGSVKA